MSHHVDWPDRGRQVKRHWNILKLLAVDRFATFETIAAETGVSIKTIRRDLVVLEEVGFPIHYVTNPESAGNGKFIRLDRNWLQLQVQR